MQHDQRVGVLLPASVGGVVASFSLALLGKTSVNLNFSLGEDLLKEACVRAEIQHIITTRKLVKRLGMVEDSQFIYIEDAAAKTSAIPTLPTGKRDLRACKEMIQQMAAE